jgi:hypothetical protein
MANQTVRAVLPEVAVSVSMTALSRRVLASLEAIMKQRLASRSGEGWYADIWGVAGVMRPLHG